MPSGFEQLRTGIMIFLWIAALAAAIAGGRAEFSPKDKAPHLSSTAATWAYVEDLPGVVTGTATAAQRVANSRIINAHLGHGEHLRLRSGTRIEIGRTLKVASGGSIIGDAGSNKPVIYMAADAFNNANDAADRGRYASNAVGIDFSGELGGSFAPSAGVSLANLTVVSEHRMSRRLRAIVGRNVTGCSIRNVEISGFPIAIGLALASARQCLIKNVYIHDFADNTLWQQLPQSTGIEIDNDTVHGIGSSDNRIEHFRIERLELGRQSLAKWGYQTDGINILSSAVRTQIVDGEISNVGEGIDTFGTDGTISHVKISNAYNFGLKFIHGASRNRVGDVVITNAGLAGVTFSGSDVSTRDTAHNVLTDIRIVNVDPNGDWRGNSTAGVLVSGRNSRRLPVDNEVINADIELGTHGKYGWLDDSTGSGNRGSSIAIHGGPALERRVLVLHKGSSVELRTNP
jgi:hypothetical protein